jgi:carboxylesterase type B
LRTYSEYITPTVLLAEQLHCGIGNLSCFLSASYQDIVLAQQKVDQMITSFQSLLFFEPWVPVIDNVVVRGQLLDTLHNTSFSLKPLIIGTVAEEGFGFFYTPDSKPLSPTLYVEGLLGVFREHALKVVERYPPEGTGDQRPLFAKIITQWGFACPNRVFARKAASYLYVFGYPPDFDGWLFTPKCKRHVCHGDELSYLFESAWYNFTDAGRRVSQSMATSWSNFGKSEDPNEPVSLRIQWPRATVNESYLYFQDPLDVRKSYMKDDCDFWDTIGYKETISPDR